MSDTRVRTHAGGTRNVVWRKKIKGYRPPSTELNAERSDAIMGGEKGMKGRGTTDREAQIMCSDRESTSAVRL